MGSACYDFSMPRIPATIRQAVPSDATRLAELGAETFRETFAADNTPDDLAAAPIPRGPAVVAAGLPADLLRRRPDVRAAERALAAQAARVGVATADLYPRLSLNGVFAFTSTSTDWSSVLGWKGFGT